MADIISFSTYAKHQKIRIIFSSKAQKKGKRKPIKPKIQGDLDGLCGVYSVINAMRAVCKRKHVDKERLFKHLLHTLEKDTSIKDAMLTGTYKSHIDHMLKAATTYIGKKHGSKIAVQPLFKRKTKLRLGDYWKTVQAFLNESNRGCILIGYRGKHDHWTVVHDVTDDALKLLDSGGSKRIRRSSCQLGKPSCNKYYYLLPSQVWGIRLQD